MPRKRQTGDGGLYYIPSRKLWRGVVDVGFWPDGRRRQQYVHSRSQAKARDKMDEMKAELATYGETLDKKTTVATWADHWLTTVTRPHLKPNAQAAYESVTRNWIIPAIGKRPVAALQPSDVRMVLKKISDAGRKSSTALKVYNVLSGMLESARMDGLAKRNVVADVVAPKAGDSGRGALATQDAISALRVAAGDLDGTRWWTALLGGLRQSERLGARIDSIDFDNNILKVEWALEEVTREHGCEIVDGKWSCGKKRGASCSHARFKLPDGIPNIHLYGRLFLLPPKSNKTREVPIIPELAEALRRYLASTSDWPNPYGLIWRHPDGTPYLPHEDNEAWGNLLYRAGIITEEQAKIPKDREEGTPEPPTTHWARHTTATVLMELGVDAKIVGEIVGHVDEKTTRRYQHVSSPAAREAMGRLSGHYAKALTARPEGDASHDSTPDDATRP